MAISVNYETKTAAIATAAREFLTIVIGVALGYAIAVRGPDIPGLKIGSPTMTIWCREVGALAVYILYASRFYLNNWLYLSESYDDKLLESMRLNAPENRSTARWLMARCYLDLILSVYSAIIISVASIFGLSASGGLVEEQWHHIAQWLMWCLMAHYAVDGLILFFTTFLKGKSQLNRVRSSLWILNNFIFFILFAFHNNDVEYSWLLWALFWNCVAAIVITLVSPILTEIALRYDMLD